MKESLSAATARPVLWQVLAATFVTLAVLFGVMAQQQSLAAPVGLGAKTGITEAQPAATTGLVLVHHKSYGHKRKFKRAHKQRHFKFKHGRSGHRFKGYGFKRQDFKGHGFKKHRFKRHHHGFTKFRFGRHRGFRSFRHRGGYRKYRY